MQLFDHWLPGISGTLAAFVLIYFVRPEGVWWLVWGYAAVALLLGVAWFVRGLLRG